MGGTAVCGAAFLGAASTQGSATMNNSAPNANHGQKLWFFFCAIDPTMHPKMTTMSRVVRLTSPPIACT